MRIPLLLAVVCCISIPAVSTAQISDTTASDLRVWHRDNPVRVAGEGRAAGPILANEHFIMRPSEVINVLVLDANQLLFTYTVTKGPSTPSPNQLATEELFKAAASFASLLPAAAGRAAPGLTTIEKLDVTGFRDAIRRVDAAVDGLAQTLDASLAVRGNTPSAYQQSAEAFQKPLAEWPTLATRGKEFVQELEAIQSKCAQDPNATLTTTPPPAGGAVLTCSSLTIRAILDPFNAYSKTFSDRIKLLESVNSDAQGLKVVSYDALPFEKTDTSVIIEIKPNTKYAAFLSTAAKRAQASGVSTIRIPFRAHTNWIFSPGGGVVFSRVPNPTFKAVPENGKYKVVENTTGELYNYSVAAMLNMQPRKWYDPAGVSLSFQLGITPTKDQVGVVGGIAVSILDKLVIGGGRIQRQIRKLADGVQPILDSPEQLKTENTWNGGGGWYVVFTYTP